MCRHGNETTRQCREGGGAGKNATVFILANDKNGGQQMRKRPLVACIMLISLHCLVTNLLNNSRNLKYDNKYFQ